MNDNELSPIFIVGCPRSGTTLLASLLERTPWGAPFETHFITKYGARLRGYGDLSDRAAFRRLMRAILAERPVRQWRLDLDIDAFYDSLKQFDYASIVDSLCRAHTVRLGLRSWGDKTPHYVSQIALLQGLFPQSKFIYIVRDGRDVALSLMRMPWGPANILSCASYWKQCNEVEAEVDGLGRKGMLHRIKYEDLLASPRGELQTLFDFLEVDSSAAIPEEVVQGIRPSNCQKWQRELTPAQIRVFEEEAGDALSRLGYGTSHRPRRPPRATVLKSKVHDRFKHYVHLIKMNTIDEVAIRWFGKEPFAE